MKQYFEIALSFIFCLSMVLSAEAQNKKKKVVKESSVEAPPPPPPQLEELREVKIDVVPTDKTDKERINSIPDIPVPEIDFDTTAAPNDELTRDILQLLELTNAMNIGQVFAQGLSKPEEQNELLKEFYKRFFKEMKDGDAHKWMMSLFVKAYRQRYTGEEIQELVKFYQTPLGKKVIKETVEMLPAVMKEGEKIGKYLGARIMNEILSEKKDN